MQSFIHTFILFIWSGTCFHLSLSDEPWSLRISNSGRDGRFLNVPIYYGDWVPISRAKQTIEAVASKIQAANKPVRRKDPPPDIITADQPEDRLDIVVQPNVPYEVHNPSHHHQQQQRHHWSQPQKHPSHQRFSHHQHRPNQQQRRRNNDRTRGHRKLPPPSPFVNQFTSLFQQQSQQSPVVVTTAKPEPVEVTTSSSRFNLGSVFNFLNPLIQHKPDIILHDTPVIKTLPAPDLTKVHEHIFFKFVKFF